MTRRDLIDAAHRIQKALAGLALGYTILCSFVKQARPGANRLPEVLDKAHP
jgi:hypothetical protein